MIKKYEISLSWDMNYGRQAILTEKLLSNETRPTNFLSIAVSKEKMKHIALRMRFVVVLSRA